MYAVVGCNGCSALWVVEGRPETTQCPRCGKRRQYGKLKQFVTTDDRDHAREVRASMLAARQGESETFADLDSFAAMETQLDDAGVGDDEYLDESGIDADEVAAAGERAGSGSGSGTPSRQEVVETAVAELSEPTADDVAAYAADHGVDPDWARRALEKLSRAGRLSENGGVYRQI